MVASRHDMNRMGSTSKRSQESQASGSPGLILFLMPSSMAMSIAEKAR